MTDINHAVFQECLRLAGEIKQKCPFANVDCDKLVHSLEYLKALADTPATASTRRDFSECKTYPDAVRAYLEEIGEQQAVAGEVFEGLVRAGYWKARLAGARKAFNHGIVANNSAGIETIKDGASTADEWVVRIRPTRKNSAV